MGNDPLWTALSSLCSKPGRALNLSLGNGSYNAVSVRSVSEMTAEEHNARERRRASIVVMLRGYPPSYDRPHSNGAES